MLLEDKMIVADPLVSVIMTTYNHSKFIAQAIDSVLSQKTNFPIELIIGEDCSTDNTRQICLDYQQKHPTRIRLFLPEENVGFLRNYGQLLKLCRGKYIAIISGDDYWCDNTKLQKQYDCLEQKEGYGFVRTLGYELHGEALVETTGGHMDNEGDVREIAIYGPLGFASSTFFERDLLKYFDTEELIRRGITLEDYPMNAIFSHHTKFALIRERMVVYRILDVSVSRPVSIQKKTNYIIGYHEARKYIKELFPNEVPWTYDDILDSQNYAWLKLYYYTFDFKSAQSLSFVTSQFQARLLVKYSKNRLSFYLLSIILRFRKK